MTYINLLISDLTFYITNDNNYEYIETFLNHFPYKQGFLLKRSTEKVQSDFLIQGDTDHFPQNLALIKCLSILSYQIQSQVNQSNDDGYDKQR